MDLAKPIDVEVTNQVILPFTRMERTLGPPTPESSFNILVADGMNERVNLFRLRARGKPFELKFVYSHKVFEEALLNPPKEGWSVIYTSGYLGDWSAHMRLKDPLLAAHEKKAFKALFLYTPILHVAQELLLPLSAAGVLCAWYPYDATSPGSHVRREFNPTCLKSSLPTPTL